MSATYRNASGSPINVNWCVEPTHWLTETHDAPTVGDPGFQNDAFQVDAFQMALALPDLTASFSVDAGGGLLTIDGSAVNGPVIELALVAAGLEEI